MIFVTVGSNQFPFDRLLRAVDGLAVEEEVVVQHGPSPVRPAGARCFDFLSFEDVGALVRRARVVVCHGGVGSVLVALEKGKRPLAVPRLARFGETTDDHQLDTVRRLGAAGLVTPVLDPGRLAATLRSASAADALPAAGATSLVGDLRAYILVAVGREPADSLR